MPSCVVEFPIGAGAHLPRHLYRALDANPLQWFADAAELSEALHERPVCEPFSISVLFRGELCGAGCKTISSPDRQRTTSPE